MFSATIGKVAGAQDIACLVVRWACSQALSQQQIAAIPMAGQAPPKVEIVQDEQIYRAQPRRQHRASLARQLLAYCGHSSIESRALGIHGKVLPRGGYCQSSLPAPHSTPNEQPFPGRQRPVDPLTDSRDGWLRSREGLE